MKFFRFAALFQLLFVVAAGFSLKGATGGAAGTNSAKYYFNIALPIGKRTTKEVVQIIKGGTLLELVENRVGDALEQIGLGNVRFGWDGRLNPAADDKDPQTMERQAESLIVDDQLVLQFNVEGSILQGHSQESVQKAIQALQGSDFFLSGLAEKGRLSLGVNTCPVDVCRPGKCKPLANGFECHCQSPWTGERCERFSDMSIEQLKGKLRSFKSFEGNHHSDFTMFLEKYVGDLESGVKEQIQNIARLRAVSIELSKACCTVLGQFRHAKEAFSSFLSYRTQTAANNTSETWSCPLPVPNSFAHVQNAQENSVLGNRLKDIGQQIRSKVQDFGVFMGGANGFMEEFNSKVQAVMYDVDELNTQANVVLSNHDFIFSACKGFFSNIEAITSGTHFRELNAAVRTQLSSTPATSVVPAAPHVAPVLQQQPAAQMSMLQSP